ncbi:hypothetical protein F5Y03DRAFT_377481 [Xylaria venustula]|nr:hypothetical protein F5Y03DRAFT_377481 [Xylaria venustula]
MSSSLFYRITHVGKLESPSRVNMSSLRNQLWQTAKAAFNKYGEMTPESVIANRSPDCVHRIFPASAGVPDRSNKEYSDFVMELKKTVPNLRLIVQDDFEPVVDETTRRVVAHIKSKGDTPFGPCDTEYFMALKMNEDGTQIVEFVEFIDSAFTLEFIKKAALTV